LFDLEKIAASSTMHGNVAIPLIRELTRMVAESSPGADAYVHWGATSQDIVDSGLVLQLRDVLDLTRNSLANLSGVLAGIVREHASTVMAGRTWLQHATPTTFGLKIAGALDALLRHEERLAEMTPRVLVLQFGGAAGTLASLGEGGEDVASALAEQLKLQLPDVPWHSQRDRLVEVGGFYAGLTSTIGKLVSDFALLMQTEIAELAEPHGKERGGSSTMPHKRNPVLTAAILSEAVRVPGLHSTLLTAAMVQQHERGLTGWQTEWATLPELCVTAHGVLEAAGTLAAQITVDTEAIGANLGRTRGFLLAESVSMELARVLGRAEAHALVQRVLQAAEARSVDLATALRADAEVAGYLSGPDIDRLMDPGNYLGSTAAMVRRVLQRYDAREHLGGR
jgi:3-carboxy-cis,cis-muconate cycloisomerase